MTENLTSTQEARKRKTGGVEEEKEGRGRKEKEEGKGRRGRKREGKRKGIQINSCPGQVGHTAVPGVEQLHVPIFLFKLYIYNSHSDSC